MSQSYSVLMYHAIGTSSAIGEIADPHYAVSQDTLARHLRVIQGLQLDALAVSELLENTDRNADAVGLTFDDGHVSNLPAARMLAEHGMSADFFINPGTIGTRGFLSWRDVDEMVGLGMGIQSHGLHHDFMDEMPIDRLRQELKESKSIIEQRTGKPVSLLAPPGGRMNDEVVAVAFESGYDSICSSVVGVWRHDGNPKQVIPRVAIIHATSDARVKRWIRRDKMEFSRQKFRQTTLSAAKRIIGFERYQRWRARLVS